MFYSKSVPDRTTTGISTNYPDYKLQTTEGGQTPGTAPLRDVWRNYSSPQAELCCTHNESDRNDVTH